jgi:hypothetical protein
LLLPKKVAELVKHLAQFSVGTTSMSGSVFGRRQHQVVKLNDLEPIAALSSINQEHTGILQALTIKKQTLPVQLTLL